MEKKIKRKKKDEKEHHGLIKRVKSSIGTKLSLFVIIAIMISLVIIGLSNAFLLVPFYTRNKQKRLYDAKDELETYFKGHTIADGFSDELTELATKENITITVSSDGDFTKSITTSNDPGMRGQRLFGYWTSLSRDVLRVIKKTDNYKIQISRDRKTSTTNLEMWGTLNNGEMFLLQTPIESIEDAAGLSSKFYIIVGIIVAGCAAIIVGFLMKRYTRPIVQLNDLSKQMANLDFDQRYTGQTEDEVGQLGASFNKMSDELERTISELKTANLELTKDNEKKTQIDEMRREFLNNVTHELKTPIALIQGYAEGLKDNVADDAESRNFYVDVIIDESAKMNNMVKQLLTLNRLEFGNDTIEMDRFDLTQLIAGVIKGMKVMIEENKAHVSFPYHEPVYVWGDEFKIEEVITNYLSNACHHVNGERIIEVTMKREKDDVVKVTVFNTGDPIAEDSIGHVFEKFYKVDKARTRAYGGSGIGLSIVKAIVEGHHQKYGVENYQNGVAFWFTMDGGVNPKQESEKLEDAMEKAAERNVS